ncbi:hypothetical protein LSM04_006301 [Trypanosoma melophagium]|uniref:uncharacterized protein n=1 Tax=Trypanosoma melophagium TaxID=715481 RepID=UPI00351A7D59|nr:hypothetical protein LSM04_006301 [Trypanosoma melophagium]
MDAPEDGNSDTHSFSGTEGDACVSSSAEDSLRAAATPSSSRSNDVDEEHENEEEPESCNLNKETNMSGYSKEIISFEHLTRDPRGDVRMHTTASISNTTAVDDHMNIEIARRPPFVGLVNEGCTCYLNALLQLLFHLGYFREAVYRMPVDDDDHDDDDESNNNNSINIAGKCSIPRALQELFFQMQEGDTPAHTKRLTDAFDWGEKELFVQHDIQEMATLLRDNLEEKMKGTVTEGTINQLFQGCGEQKVETLDKQFKSCSRDVFYDIHLPLGSNKTLIESLESLTEKELLTGDNKYRVEKPGEEPEYKDAEKSYTI